MKTRSIFGLIMVVSLVLGACATATSEPTPAPTEVPAVEPTELPEPRCAPEPEPMDIVPHRISVL
jgi:curli biogenesis system outer membrane secretion channel CsgG